MSLKMLYETRDKIRNTVPKNGDLIRYYTNLAKLNMQIARTSYRDNSLVPEKDYREFVKNLINARNACNNGSSGKPKSLIRVYRESIDFYMKNGMPGRSYKISKHLSKLNKNLRPKISISATIYLIEA